MVLFHEIYDAETAYRLGLLTEVVAEDLEARSFQFCETLAAKAPLAVRMTKMMMSRGAEFARTRHSAHFRVLTQLRDMGLVEETTDLVAVSSAGMATAGEVPPAPSSAEGAPRPLVLAPAEPGGDAAAAAASHWPEMLRTLAAQGERFVDPAELADALGKKATGGHWNSGVALLRNK